MSAGWHVRADCRSAAHLRTSTIRRRAASRHGVDRWQLGRQRRVVRSTSLRTIMTLRRPATSSSSQVQAWHGSLGVSEDLRASWLRNYDRRGYVRWLDESDRRFLDYCSAAQHRRLSAIESRAARPSQSQTIAEQIGADRRSAAAARGAARHRRLPRPRDRPHRHAHRGAAAADRDAPRAARRPSSTQRRAARLATDAVKSDAVLIQRGLVRHDVELRAVRRTADDGRSPSHDRDVAKHVRIVADCDSSTSTRCEYSRSDADRATGDSAAGASRAIGQARAARRGRCLRRLAAQQTVMLGFDRRRCDLGRSLLATSCATYREHSRWHRRRRNQSTI